MKSKEEIVIKILKDNYFESVKNRKIIMRVSANDIGFILQLLKNKDEQIEQVKYLQDKVTQLEKDKVRLSKEVLKMEQYTTQLKKSINGGKINE
jgi:vacuolar-type H+-ATPase subunit I/STV1